MRNLPTVDPWVPLLDLDLVASTSDDPLGEILLRMLGKRENGNFAAIRIVKTIRQPTGPYGSLSFDVRPRP